MPAPRCQPPTARKVGIIVLLVLVLVLVLVLQLVLVNTSSGAHPPCHAHDAVVAPRNPVFQTGILPGSPGYARYPYGIV